MLTMSVLGERLRAERKLRGWTLEQAGEVFGLPKSTLANYETGAYEPDVALLKRFASVYACSVDYLVGVAVVETSADAHSLILSHACHSHALEYSRSANISGSPVICLSLSTSSSSMPNSFAIRSSAQPPR